MTKWNVILAYLCDTKRRNKRKWNEMYFIPVTISETKYTISVFTINIITIIIFVLIMGLYIKKD